MRYLKYIKYIVVHKFWVFVECVKSGMYWHAITHDLSKFLPSEFFPYANWFYGKFGANFNDDGATESSRLKRSICEKRFVIAKELHYIRNKHHWDHWVDTDNLPHMMPEKYVVQMVCDWNAMSHVVGDTWTEFYAENSKDMIIHPATDICLLEWSSE